jgi:hypothetical protein
VNCVKPEPRSMVNAEHGSRHFTLHLLVHSVQIEKPYFSRGVQRGADMDPSVFLGLFSHFSIFDCDSRGTKASDHAWHLFSRHRRYQRPNAAIRKVHYKSNQPRRHCSHSFATDERLHPWGSSMEEAPNTRCQHQCDMTSVLRKSAARFYDGS